MNKKTRRTITKRNRIHSRWTRRKGEQSKNQHEEIQEEEQEEKKNNNQNNKNRFKMNKKENTRETKINLKRWGRKEEQWQKKNKRGKITKKEEKENEGEGEKVKRRKKKKNWKKTTAKIAIRSTTATMH